MQVWYFHFDKNLILPYKKLYFATNIIFDNTKRSMNMKKAFKIIGWTFAALIGVCLVSVVLIRFVFYQQLKDYSTRLTHEERLETLHSAGPYAPETRTDIHFQYQQDSLQADSIYRYFRLDTLISPEATTWENSVALASFVAHHIPHANSSKIPAEKSNAIGLWEYHLCGNPAFNCRYHSVLLHELLLAAGITNRVMICLPADSTDQDCHVVNIVWLPQQKKWAMIDSDQGAYITNTDSVPLSLEEMRQYALEGTPMINHFLNPGKKRNDYLSYWTKNLYWFSCLEEAGYNKETKRDGRYIHLLPKGFIGFELKDSSPCTTDPSLFWASPEE